MNGMLKLLLVLFIIVYVVSPIDLAPGPIDDILVVVLGIAAQKAISRKNAEDGY